MDDPHGAALRREHGLPAVSVEVETRRWLLRANAMLRAIQVLPWLTVLANWNADAYTHPWLVVGSYVAYAVWSTLLFAVALRRDGMAVTLVLADVAAVTVSVLVVGLSCAPGFVFTWQNWTVGPLIGAAILAALYIGVRAGVVVVGLLVAADLVAVGHDLDNNSGISWFLGNNSFLVASVVATVVIARRLNRSATQADTATSEALDAREAEARAKERVRQYDILHTNVLTTLTLVARSTGDVDPQLRERCGRDAKYLRSVVNSVLDASPLGLNATLAEVVFTQSANGLSIQYSTDGLPAELPREVIGAVSAAVTEALNNVAKYAGPAREAWVVAAGTDEPPGVTVTVTDRGAGFDPDATVRGFGLTKTITEGIAEVGGRARIRSYPGHGTSVEIQWTEPSAWA